MFFTWLAIAYAPLLWWLATCAVLYLDGLAPRTFGRSLLLCSVLAAVGFTAVVLTSASTTPLAAFAAFTGAVAVWGWNELAFLTGYLAGPRRRACHAGCAGWLHARHAVGAILYHELALIACGVLLFLASWGAPNPVGAWTFAILWAMRQSAMLNLFVGVRNTGEEFLPPHLQYLASFFRRRTMNPLFPVSITLGVLLGAWLVDRALTPGLTHGEVVGSVLLATLTALGILEHVFLMLPLQTTSLWQLGLRSRPTAARELSA